MHAHMLNIRRNITIFRTRYIIQFLYANIPYAEQSVHAHMLNIRRNITIFRTWYIELKKKKRGK